MTLALDREPPINSDVLQGQLKQYLTNLPGSPKDDNSFHKLRKFRQPNKTVELF
jgi:hypothetical protein